MKSFLAFVAASSLILNLVLVGILFAGRTASDTPAPIAVATESRAVASEPIVTNQTWAKLRTDDLPAMVKQLRASGFPPNIVSAIAAASLREAFAARIKALDPAADSRPFWKNMTIDPNLQLARSKLYREQQKALRDLMGPDADPNENINALFQGRRLDSVPAEKVDEVRRIVREFDEKRSDAFSGGGMIGPEQQRKITALEKEQHDALATLLTPRELEDYNLRNSDTARQVRYSLTAFNPTEDEFRSIYKLQAAFDAQFGRLFGMPPPDEQRRRETAQRELNEQIKATLGPVRGADYERASDHSYRQTSQLVARLELPAETTNQIWSLKKEYEEGTRTLGRDTNLTPDDRQKQLAALTQATESKISSALGGPRGFEAYKQYAGYWLQRPRPTPTPPTTPAR